MVARVGSEWVMVYCALETAVKVVHRPAKVHRHDSFGRNTVVDKTQKHLDVTFEAPLLYPHSIVSLEHALMQPYQVDKVGKILYEKLETEWKKKRN